MSEGARAPVKGIVFAHGSMAAGLVDAVRKITGCDPDALHPIGNSEGSPETLRLRLEELAGDEPVILFTDVSSGSCTRLARAICSGSDLRRVVHGVNLPMLLDFVFHRDLAVPELATRLVERGRQSIEVAPVRG